MFELLFQMTSQNGTGLPLLFYHSVVFFVNSLTLNFKLWALCLQKWVNTFDRLVGIIFFILSICDEKSNIRVWGNCPLSLSVLPCQLDPFSSTSTPPKDSLCWNMKISTFVKILNLYTFKHTRCSRGFSTNTFVTHWLI